MTATGGYDWAPWSTTWKTSPSVAAAVTSGWFSHGYQQTFSKGIWKSVYLTTVRSVAITGVVAETFYLGEYPMTPLTDESHAGFELRLRLHLEATTALPGGCTVNASASFGSVQKTLGAISEGDSNVTLVLKAPRGVRLWWPRRMGAQALYNVTISVAHGDAPPVVATRQVGFRSLALVTSNDSDPVVRRESASHDGSGGMTMFLRVNGAAIFRSAAGLGFSLGFSHAESDGGRVQSWR